MPFDVVIRLSNLIATVVLSTHWTNPTNGVIFEGITPFERYFSVFPLSHFSSILLGPKNATDANTNGDTVSLKGAILYPHDTLLR